MIANVYDMLQLSFKQMQAHAATLDARMKKIYLEDLNMMYRDHDMYYRAYQALTGTEDDDWAGTPTSDELSIYRARSHDGMNFEDKNGVNRGSWAEGSDLLRKDREMRKGFKK